MTVPDVVTNELLYEVLKSVQAQLAVIREDVGGIKTRLTSIENRLNFGDVPQ
jgi:hypothetical protein